MEVSEVFEVFEWKVRFQNFTRAFVKTQAVEAPNYQEAVRHAEQKMEQAGYNPDDFTVTLVERGRSTGRVTA